MEDQNKRSTIAQPGQIVFLGHQGENLARQVIFDLSDLRERYPEGRFALAAQRKGDALPYPAARTNLDGDALVWTLTDADTAVAGYGRCELRCYDGETLAKSEVWQTFTLPALAEYGEAPEAWADYVAQLQRIGTQVQEAQSHAPQIGENGNWQIWNAAAEQYADTGLPSRGEPGDAATADSIFVARLGSTTSAEIEAAYQAGKAVLVPINRFHAVARLTGRDDAVTHHFGAVYSDSNAEDLVAVHVTCVSDSWHVVAKTPLANRADLANNIFSEESAYSVGDYVLYRNMLYRFTAAHTGAWADGDVVRVQLAEDVKDLRTALDGKGTYSKPSGGIPKTDFAAAVQTSLGKADTALQAHQDVSGKADQTIIAPVESAMTATRNYTTGDLLIVGNALYKATANIASGGAITLGTNVSAVILSQQLSAGGSAVPEWQLLGEYDFAQLKGEEASFGGGFTLSNLGGLTRLYFRWTGMGNISSSASGLEIRINDKSMTGFWGIPTAKAGSTINGYTRMYYNGLTWETVVSPGAVSASNDSKATPATIYNEFFDVGACNKLRIATGLAQYNPDRGVLKIYGAK